jgi:uncharacterized protein YbjT (DUF2867 family)
MPVENGPEAAAAAYWRSVAALKNAAQGAEAVVQSVAAMDRQGVRELQDARAAVDTATQQERTAQQVAASSVPTTSPRRVRRRV